MKYNIENIRIIFASIFSVLVAAFTDTQHFLLALTFAFGFNVWSGMRADGVSIYRCKNFSFPKFWKAVIEFFIYVGIIWVVQGIMYSLGDKSEALLIIKSISYIFIYVYVQNGFKNCIVAYPKYKPLRIVYHLLRFELKRAMPAHVQEVINRVDKNETK